MADAVAIHSVCEWCVCVVVIAGNTWFPKVSWNRHSLSAGSACSLCTLD